MSEVKNAPGEVVRLESDQFNADGERISHMEVEWYGMENAEANVMSISLVEAVTGKAAEWGQAKASGKNLDGSDRVKPLTPRGGPSR